MRVTYWEWVTRKCIHSGRRIFHKITGKKFEKVMLRYERCKGRLFGRCK